MYLTNKQIRAKARDLLDGNIFGKDWLKSILLCIMMLVIIGSTGGVLFYLSNRFAKPFLINFISGFFESDILEVVISGLLALVDILLLNVLIGPIQVGLSAVHLDLVRGEGKIKIKNFFYGFREFFDNFQIGFMYVLHIVLWGLLFIIPGIHIGLSYALAFYVKRDNPHYRWQQCFDESEILMEGNKLRLIGLWLSFIGWFFVGFLAFFGVGCLWVYPYQTVSMAVFYDELKKAKFG